MQRLWRVASLFKKKKKNRAGANRPRRGAPTRGASVDYNVGRFLTRPPRLFIAAAWRFAKPGRRGVNLGIFWRPGGESLGVFSVVSFSCDSPSPGSSPSPPPSAGERRRGNATYFLPQTSEEEGGRGGGAHSNTNTVPAGGKTAPRR